MHWSKELVKVTLGLISYYVFIFLVILIVVMDNQINIG